ncbi:MAG: NUDIX domain-containing protein [Planctomycetota bacterium]
MPEPALPYKLACLCDLRDAQGRLLLLHRLREPNKGLCSPIGGKLEMDAGESPTQCAQREIQEEAGIDIPIDRLHLMGLISERAFEGKGHWLLFYYRVLGPVEVPEQDIPEGSLRWHATSELDTLPIPQTDRQIIWPLVRGHEARSANGLPGFFSLHIDCDANGPTNWAVEHSLPGS